LNIDHAQSALARLNIYLPTLNSRALEDVVYGRGTPSQSLVTMHTAAVALLKSKLRSKAQSLAVEALGALRLKSRQGDVIARSYLAELSAPKSVR
jgi:hypothetical protein